MIVEEVVWSVITIIVVGVIVALIFMIPTQLLWNWLMPEVFGLKKITLWQALGLLMLTGFLFRTGSSKS